MLRRIGKWRRVTAPAGEIAPREEHAPGAAHGPDSGAAPPALPFLPAAEEPPAPAPATPPGSEPPAPPAEATARPDPRRQRAAERVLENEALTADLDDDAAKVLLDWGLALADRAAHETATAPEADAALDERLAAVRRLLRRVGRWAANPEEGGADDAAWAALAGLATAAYGHPLAAPAPAELPADPAAIIAHLRRSIEGGAA